MTTQLEVKNNPQAPLSMPRVLLRLEGLAVIAAAVTAYITLGGSGWLFAALLFVPDVSMVGYLVNPRAGSIIYNAVHNYIAPAAVMGLSLLLHSDAGVHIALIWLAHIGMDRMLGFGLKYPTVFKDTHLQHI